MRERVHMCSPERTYDDVTYFEFPNYLFHDLLSGPSVVLLNVPDPTFDFAEILMCFFCIEIDTLDAYVPNETI